MDVPGRISESEQEKLRGKSASNNVVPPLTLLPLTLLYRTQTVDSDLAGNTKALSVPEQRVITAHLMRSCPSHQYVIGDISLTRSEQTLGLQSSQRFKAYPADPDPLVVIQLDIVNAYPSADRQAQFDVLAGRASKSYDNRHVHMGDVIPCPDSLRHYWSYFESM